MDAADPIPKDGLTEMPSENEIPRAYSRKGETSVTPMQKQMHPHTQTQLH